MGPDDRVLFGDDYRYDARRRERQRLHDQIADLESVNRDRETAIRENSVVLCHLIAVVKDDTTRDILQSVHDSLTDAL